LFPAEKTERKLIIPLSAAPLRNSKLTLKILPVIKTDLLRWRFLITKTAAIAVNKEAD